MADLEGRSFEVAAVAGGWLMRTRPVYAPAIQAAADVGEQSLNLREFDAAVIPALRDAGFDTVEVLDMDLEEIFVDEVGRAAPTQRLREPGTTQRLRRQREHPSRTPLQRRTGRP